MLIANAAFIMRVRVIRRLDRLNRSLDICILTAQIVEQERNG